MASTLRDVCLVGAGKMGCALLRGWLEHGVVDGDRTSVLEPHASEELQSLTGEHGVAVASDVTALAGQSFRAVVLAVKPQIMESVLPGLTPLVHDDTVFLSIAAGTRIAALEKGLGSQARAARAMPNTPASIGMGASGLYFSDTLTQDQKSFCESLMGAVGTVVCVSTEDAIDAVTAISGSGPAYVFYLMEVLTAAGEGLGLMRDESLALAIATVQGAGHLAAMSDDAPATLRANVTSPGGTTAAALEVLMADDGLAPVMQKAVKAAYKRAKDLSD